jgi:hypothetical protein
MKSFNTSWLAIGILGLLVISRWVILVIGISTENKKELIDDCIQKKINEYNVYHHFHKDLATGLMKKYKTDTVPCDTIGYGIVLFPDSYENQLKLYEQLDSQEMDFWKVTRDIINKHKPQ